MLPPSHPKQVQQSRDVTRLRSSINVFVGLMRWLEVRCESLEMLLYLGRTLRSKKMEGAKRQNVEVYKSPRNEKDLGCLGKYRGG